MRMYAGLMWEQWRQSRGFVSTGFGAILALIAAAWMAPTWFSERDVFIFTAWWVAVLVVGFVLPNHLLRGLTMAVPQRMSALPVSRGQVLLCMFVYRLLVVVALTALMWAGERLVWTSADVTLERNEWTAGFPIFLLLLALWGSAFSLFSTYLGAVSASIFTMLLPLFVLWFTVEDSLVLRIAAGLGGLVAALLGCSVLIESVPRYVGKAAGASPALDRGMNALFGEAYFDVRQALWILPAGLLGLTPFLYFIVGDYGLQALLYVPIPLAFGAGYLLFKQTQQYPTQFLLRPKTTQELAHGRLLAGTAVCALTFGAAIVFGSAVQSTRTMFVGSLELVWLFICIWASLFCGRLLLLILPLPMLLASMLGDIFMEEMYLLGVVAPLTLVLGVLVIRGIERKIISWPFFVWTLAAIALALLARYAIADLFADPSYLLLAVTLFLLPLVWVPVAIDWQRHR